MENDKKLDDEQLKKLENISSRIFKIYDGIECNDLNVSCLNSVRQSLEYLCLYTCEVYDIKITRKTKKGDIVENDNPTLGDMAPLIEKYFKNNNVLWSKEVGMHIGSIWIVGNLGSHAQKDVLQSNSEISKATIQNALNSMYIVTDWFYKHYNVPCPINPKNEKKFSDEEQKIIDKTNHLYEKLASLKHKNEAYLEEDKKKKEVDESAFDDIYFDDLIEAIELGQCVLFVGPNLSVDDAGNSLHNNFYKKISRRNIEYNEEDGFFMPKAEKQIELKALNYYSKSFNNENVIGNKIIEKLVQIPFSLIVSVTPDNTVKHFFEKYNKKHDFVFYNPRTKHEVNEPTKEQPVIFNMLGNAAEDGKYIFTHKQFYEYVNQKQDVKIPFEIESKIKDVAHYLFIGIDFNKWYNRLLLFALNLYDEAEAYSFNSDSINQSNHDFVNKQFNISFIDENYENFVDILLQKCDNENIRENLIETFIENTGNEISKISQNKIDDNVFEKLLNIENKITNILTTY